MPPTELDEIVREFLIEGHDYLDQLDRELLTLEANPTAREAIQVIFRTVHTIKGSCGVLGFSKLEALAHVGESLLVGLRDGDVAVTRHTMNALLALGDALRAMLRSIEAGRGEGETDDSALIETLTRLRSGQPKAPHAATAPSAAPAPTDERGGRAPSVSAAQIRVGVERLDDLVNLVGELILTRNRISQLVPERESTGLYAARQRLDLITTEIQSGVMKARMQPIRRAWEKLPRVVRDLAATLGKEASIEMEGGEVELDRTLIEAIKDPLLHLVRNCVDHGIELPSARVAVGKGRTGILRLAAHHEAGQLNVEVSDDGAGLDTERIRATAAERGFITPDEATGLSEREVWNLIFLPGFSTAEGVSHISGRGVGMDVVRTQIENVGGSVELTTRAGRETTFKIRLPLTLAIIPALIVTSGGERYAIPQGDLVEILRPDAGETDAEIDQTSEMAPYHLRGAPLSLVHLDRIFQSPRSGRSHIVVVNAGRRRFGLVVDEIDDIEEIVVKPLPEHLKEISTFAGATILGDGRIALILDAIGIARRAGLGLEESEIDRPVSPSPGDAAPAPRQELLLFQTRTGRRLAIPIASIARVEKLAAAGETSIVIDVDQVLGHAPDALEHPGGYLLILHDTGAGRVGLAVDRIVDIVDESVTIGPDIEPVEILDVPWLARHSPTGRGSAL